MYISYQCNAVLSNEAERLGYLFSLQSRCTLKEPSFSVDLN